MKNKIITLIMLSIAPALFIGCSNTDITLPDKKNNEYIVGQKNAKHKILFVDYDRQQNITNKVTIYTDDLNGKIHFNLCNQNKKYIIDRQNQIKQGYNREKIKNYDKTCKSYVELLEEKDNINLRYGISFYKYFKPTGMNTTIPVTRHESVSPVTINKTHENTYVDGKYSYWKFIY